MATIHSFILETVANDLGVNGGETFQETANDVA